MDRFSAPKPKDPENLIIIIIRWRPDLTGPESFQPVSTQNHHRRQKPSSTRHAEQHTASLNTRMRTNQPTYQHTNQRP